MTSRSQVPIWRLVGKVKLRNEYLVERKAYVYRVSSKTSREADFGQSVDRSVARHIAQSFEGQTVTVEQVEEALLESGLPLPYQYGYKLHFYAQNVLVVLVADGKASHAKAGRRFEYHLA